MPCLLLSILKVFRKELIHKNVIKVLNSMHLLPIESAEKGVLGVGSIPVAILPSCQDMKTIAL